MTGAPPDLAAQGWRWPAEWETHHATWLAWPHNPATWPGRIESIFAPYVEMIRVLHQYEPVCVCVRDEAMEADARRRLAAGGVDADRGVRFHHVPTDDTWARDHGPIFVVREREGRREKAIVDFGFNSWGEKYGPWENDDAVPARICEILGLPRVEAGFVLEGGSIDGNGLGAILTTESCLLNPNRGPERTREGMEGLLARLLGARHVLWLGDGIEGDDTDGHIDDLARFVDAGTVVTVVEEDPFDANHARLAENLRRLRSFRDQDGKPLTVATLPMPPPLLVEGQRCPASYANFYLANGVALVPVFGAPSDARALAILRDLLPGRQIAGIPSADLVFGLGAMHCMTQQEPA
ncbi:MAG: agmatine deiminase family protein [Deltaproteobacteria bacterium]|nr:agmatine deiminase family protein [Deltaproteobacteria bacterium]